MSKDQSFIEAMKRLNTRIEKSSAWALNALISGTFAFIFVCVIKAVWDIVLWK